MEERDERLSSDRCADGGQRLARGLSNTTTRIMKAFDERAFRFRSPHPSKLTYRFASNVRIL